ncbi:MAG: hypothetical protein ABSB10_00445 [Candidatus Bathyarchaeia archaeon]|jgi:hypothetical protein
MTHDEICDNCGKMAELKFEFFYNRDGLVDSRRYRFCYDCGVKIEELLKEGVN